MTQDAREGGMRIFLTVLVFSVTGFALAGEFDVRLALNGYTLAQPADDINILYSSTVTTCKEGLYDFSQHHTVSDSNCVECDCDDRWSVTTCHCLGFAYYKAKSGCEAPALHKVFSVVEQSGPMWHNIARVQAKVKLSKQLESFSKVHFALKYSYLGCKMTGLRKTSVRCSAAIEYCPL